MKRQTLNCNGRLVFIDRPMVMAIVNITPDSFYDGGSYLREEDLLKRYETVIAEGADIIDLGAVSTRPGANPVDAAEECKRLESALILLRKYFPDVLVSVDTFRAEIARHVVTNYNVGIINDISAGEFDADMFVTVAELNVPYVIMHMQGTPQTMQANPTYDDLINDMIRYFSERIHQLHLLGAKDIIIDPGFGFGKTMGHNYEILRRLKDFEIFELPVLVGASRKSMIYKLLETDPGHALNGTTVVNTLALLGDADILRVHDVKEAVECVKITQEYQNAELSVTQKL